MNDFLEQLAELDVPPPPERFTSELHDRVNRSLVLVQLVELACAAVPYAVMELSRALGGLVRYSLCGKYEFNERKKS